MFALNCCTRSLSYRVVLKSNESHWRSSFYRQWPSFLSHCFDIKKADCPAVQHPLNGSPTTGEQEQITVSDFCSTELAIRAAVCAEFRIALLLLAPVRRHRVNETCFWK